MLPVVFVGFVCRIMLKIRPNRGGGRRNEIGKLLSRLITVLLLVSFALIMAEIEL